MSATLKSGSDRTVCNQDKQQSLMGYNKDTEKLSLVRTDGVTDSLLTISSVHHEIHAGNYFYIQGFLIYPAFPKSLLN